MHAALKNNTAKNKNFKLPNNSPLLDRYNMIQFSPLLFIAAIIPLIVRVKLLTVDDFMLDFWKNDRQYADIFSYYKSIWILIAGSISFILFTFHCIKSKLSIKSPAFYGPVVLYALLIILSSLFSEYKSYAFTGYPDRFEGMWVLLSYLIILVAAANLIRYEKQFHYIFASLFVSAIIISFIGIFQYLEHDLFQSAFGFKLILPSEYYDILDTIRQKAGDSTHYINSMYGTLYNSNSFGMYMSMLFPLSLILYFSVHRTIFKITFGFMTLIYFTCLVGSNSRGAWLGGLLSAAGALGLLAIKKHVTLRKKSVFSFIFCFLVIFVLMNARSGDNLLSRIGFKSAANSSVLAQRDLKIKDYIINGPELTLLFAADQLKIIHDNGSLLFYNTSGQQLEIENINETNKYVVNEKPYDDIEISIDNNLISIVKQNSLLRFAAYEGGFVFVNARGKIIKELDTVETFGFKGNEQIASSRGYIWSRTLPLLKTTMFLGYGPDTFAFYFPQFDYKGKLNHMYDANIIIDKPHNLFLQIALNTGVISLLAFLTLLGFYYYKAISFICKRETLDTSLLISVALLAAVTAYLIAGLFTDSVVSVSPVFWVLLGSGIGLSHSVKPNYCN